MPWPTHRPMRSDGPEQVVPAQKASDGVNSPTAAPSKPKKQPRVSKEERRLLERVRSGDVNAYGELVRKYENRIVAVLVGMVRNREDARDLAQKAFIRAYDRLDRFQERSSFYTWLYRIAFNLAIDFKRSQARRPTDEYDDARAVDSVEHAAPDAGPEHNTRRARLRNSIQEAIEALPKDQRAVVVLREIEGLAYREIAEILEIPEGTVMSRLFYARKRLQQSLAETREEWK